MSSDRSSLFCLKLSSFPFRAVVSVRKKRLQTCEHCRVVLIARVCDGKRDRKRASAINGSTGLFMPLSAAMCIVMERERERVEVYIAK